MKEKTTSAKLKSYSSLAISFIAVAGAADAQVVYTDIVDYTGTMNGDIYKLDLDNDGSTDFTIFRVGSFTTGSSYETVQCDAPGSNGIVGAGSYADALAVNTAIGSSNNWLTGSTDMIMAKNSQGGNIKGQWPSQNDHYLGLMIMISGSPHYGWARLDVNKLCNMFTIKDYAYDKTAKTTIKAGDKGITTSIAGAGSQNAKVYAFGKTITVNTTDAAAISVRNVLGQEVKTLTTSAAKTEVDMNDMPAGVYFVTVTTGGSSATVKVHLM